MSRVIYYSVGRHVSPAFEGVFLQFVYKPFKINMT